MHDGTREQLNTRRGRGRPRTRPAVDPTAPKRGRGRPRKDFAPTPEQFMAHPAMDVAATTTSLEPDDTMSESTIPPIYEPHLAAMFNRRPGNAARLNNAWPRLTRLYREQLAHTSRKTILMIGLFAVLLGVYGTYRHSSLSRTVTLQAAMTQSKLIAKVARLTDLPSGEQPTVYTVTDQSKASQPFLSNARNGDQLLVYKQAGKAIVYRLSTDKIIAVGPVAPQLSSARGGTSKNILVALYNGSSQPGITGGYEQKVGAQPATSVVMREKAARSDYPNTLVIDLRGSHKQQAENLATLIGATTGVLPEGEIAPEADILIIVGADFKP